VDGNAILVRDGHVAGVGRAEDLIRPGIPVAHYPGGVIIPGLRDAHMHPVPYAQSLSRPTLKEATDIDDLLVRLRSTAADLPAGAPLVAIRMDDESLADRRLPTRHDLDLAVEDHPVLVYRYCGHIAVANTLALQTAGIGPTAEDPVGGILDRDEFGVPNGILRETALEPVARALADRFEGPEPEAVVAALAGLTTLGLTALGAIASVGSGPWCDTGDELQVLLNVADRLPLKIGVLVIADSPGQLEQAARDLEAAGPRLRFLGLKEFADGSLGGHTAALSLPYADQPAESGTLRFDTKEVGDRARTALRLGGRVAIHAIGDVAVRQVLDLFDELIGEGADPHRLRVEHASVLDRDLIERFSRSGVTASIQPAFMASEAGWLGKRLGSARLATTYPLASLFEAGVAVAGGSDCPVEPPHPLWGLAAARDRAGLPPAQERLSGEQALHLFTDGATAAIDEPPPLSIGSPADLTVLDLDPVESSPEEVRRARVLATWIDGQVAAFPHHPTIWKG
jgi:predicted amidohydrolase YtcJ